MTHLRTSRLGQLRIRLRAAVAAVLVGALSVFAACSGDSTTQPTVNPVDDTSIEAQIRALFPAGASLRDAALTQIASIRQQLVLNATAEARSRTLTLVDFTMTSFRDAKLVGGTSVTTGNAASRLVNALYQLVGMAAPNLPDSALTNDGVAKVVGPEGAAVVTPSGVAGVQIPAGALDQQVLVTVTRLPTPPTPGTGPLPTSLKQYPPYYDFSTFPAVAQFGSSARVGLCQVTDPASPFYPPEPHDRLRLAHTVAGNIEILDRVAVDDFLRCTGVSATRSASGTRSFGWRGALASLGDVISRLGPAELYAAHGGLGGKVKSFSPFAAVDPVVKTVTVTLASPSVTVGNSVQATAVLKDADGNVLTGRVVTWTSSNAAVATVSSSGLVTGVATGGPVTIAATSEGQSGTAAVTVTPAPVASVTFENLCLDPATLPGIPIGVCGSIVLQTLNPATGGTNVTIWMHSEQGSLAWNDATTSSAVNGLWVGAPGWGSVVGGLGVAVEGPVAFFGTRDLSTVFTIGPNGTGFQITNFAPDFTLKGGAVGCFVSPVTSQYRPPFLLVQYCVPQNLNGSLRFDFTTSGVWTAEQLGYLQISLQWVTSNSGGGGGCNAPPLSSGPGTCTLGPKP